MQLAMIGLGRMGANMVERLMLAGHQWAIDEGYGAPGTFAAPRAQLGQARRPAHYLAVPPGMFATVARGLKESGTAVETST